MDLKKILFIALIGTIIWFYISNSAKDKKIMELTINTKYYQEQNRKLDSRRDSINLEIEKSNRIIDSLKKVLSKLPTDNEIINQNPINRIRINDSWSKIIRPIESAIDSPGE